MTANRQEKLAARQLQADLDVPHVQALRLMRTVREAQPSLRGVELQKACRAILDKERSR